MRKVITSLFITLDGVVEAPNLWQFDVFDNVMMDAITTQKDTADTVLLGRVTYQEWLPFWPTSTDEPYAGWINNATKYVASKTIDKVEWGKWGKISVLEGDLAKAVAKLKQGSGKNIAVEGSPSVVRYLLQNDLLDDLLLFVHPVMVGGGKRLFTGEGDLKRLKVADSKTNSNGVVIVNYQPAKN